MNELQTQLLIMMNDFKERADKINLSYSLYGGTALGGVRHGGFIPWDDDVDFAIDYENRKKIIDNFEKVFSDKFNLITEYGDGLCHFMKLSHKTLEVDVNSDWWHDDDKYLWLDFFTIGRTKKKVPFLYKIATHIKFASNFKRKDKKEYILSFLRKILRIIFPGIIMSRIMRYYLEKGKGEYMFSDFTWDLKVFRDASFENMEMISFENNEFPIFRNYNKHLESYFGKDYMTLPPEEDRITHGLKLKNDESKK